jgi:hypothetical protein
MGPLPTAMLHLRSLTVLRLEVLPVSEADGAAGFEQFLRALPPRLTLLRVCIYASIANLDRPMGCLNDAISKIETLETVDIELMQENDDGDWPDRWTDGEVPVELLTSLQSLPHLTTLCLNQLSRPEGIDAVRAISGLRELQSRNRHQSFDGARMDEHSFSRLTAAPTPKLAVCEHIPTTITVQLLPSLLRLAASLTELRCRIEVADLRPILSQFTSLTRLLFTISPENDPPSLVEALQQMTQLQSLELRDLPVEMLTSPQIADVLRPLIQLKKLELSHSPGLTSLEFLSACSPTLTELAVTGCPALSPIEVHHVRQCRSLEAMEFWWSFTERFDAHTIGMMTPGASNFQIRTWPKLKVFSYEAREDDHFDSDVSDAEL